MSRTADKLFNSLRESKSVEEGFEALGAALVTDPLLAVGLAVIVGIVYLLGRIYIWPTVNPFQIQWVSNLWDWATSPRPPTAEEAHPYAKVIYPTYR